MSKHTPGPWAWWSSNSWRRLGTADGLSLVAEPVRSIDGHPDMYFRNGGPDGPDARLIAAAPDLLEACEAFLRPPDGRTAHAIKLARAAIDKAKGGG